MSSFHSTNNTEGSGASTVTASTASQEGGSQILVDPKMYWTCKLCEEDLENVVVWSDEWLLAASEACRELAVAKGISRKKIFQRIPVTADREQLQEIFTARLGALQPLEDFQPGSWGDVAGWLAAAEKDILFAPTETREECEYIILLLYKVANIVCPAIAERWKVQKADLDREIGKNYLIQIHALQDFFDEGHSFLKALLNDIRGEDGDEHQ